MQCCLSTKKGGGRNFRQGQTILLSRSFLERVAKPAKHSKENFDQIFLQGYFPTIFCCVCLSIQTPVHNNRERKG